MSATIDTGPLGANLAVLCDTLPPEAAARIRAAAPAPEASVVSTPSGRPTLFAFGRYAYSRHDPMREALRLVEREIPRTTEVCLFYNFGLGYHIEAFLDSHPDGHAVVVEPDLSWLITALSSRDLRRLLRDPRLVLALDVEPPRVILLLDDGPHSPYHVVRLRALSEKDLDYFERLDSLVGAMISRREVNDNTLARFGRLWVRNLVQNIELVASSPGVRHLGGAFSGLPALILAAGPSLDEVLPDLGRLREKALIISVDTSYGAAVAAGVVPDFLLVVDPQYWNSRHLDRYPCDTTILVSESSTFPGIFRHSRAPLYLCGSLFPLGSYLEAEVDEKGKLGAGGSVSTTAWDFARSLGCTPIVFAGLDLGFPDLKTHFHGGFFEERTHLLASRTVPAEAQAFHALRDGGPFYEQNNSGGLSMTDRRLIVYRWWFENQFLIHPEATSLTLSPKGIRIQGLPLCGLDELLSRPVIRPEIEERLAPLRAAGAREPVDLGEAPSAPSHHTVLHALHRSLERLIAELDALRDAARAGIEAADDLERRIEEGAPVDQVLRRLQEVDGWILGVSSKDVAGFLMHRAAREILDRTEPADGRMAARNSRALYASLLESAHFHIEQLEGALGRLTPIARQDLADAKD